MADPTVVEALRYVLLVCYILLCLFAGFQCLRYMVLLRGRGISLKTFYGLLSFACLLRMLQFSIFALSNFSNEATAGFLITFAASVIYFSAYIFLVFLWAETSLVSHSNPKHRILLRWSFGILLCLIYACCVAFMVVVVELQLTPNQRFRTSVIGTATVCLISSVAMVFFATLLHIRMNSLQHSISSQGIRSLRKIWLITIICASTFFIRALYLYLSGTHPDTFQPESHLEFEFYYYVIVEIAPTALILLIVGKLSNNKMRKMTRKHRRSQRTGLLRIKDKDSSPTSRTATLTNTPVSGSGMSSRDRERQPLNSAPSSNANSVTSPLTESLQLEHYGSTAV